MFFDIWSVRKKEDNIKIACYSPTFEMTRNVDPFDMMGD